MGGLLVQILIFNFHLRLKLMFPIYCGTYFIFQSLYYFNSFKNYPLENFPLCQFALFFRLQSNFQYVPYLWIWLDFLLWIFLLASIIISLVHHNFRVFYFILLNHIHLLSQNPPRKKGNHFLSFDSSIHSIKLKSINCHHLELQKYPTLLHLFNHF